MGFVPRRDIEHAERFKIAAIHSTPVTRGQARAIEQALISNADAAGRPLQNKINSISSRRPFYEQAVEYGRDWLSHLD